MILAYDVFFRAVRTPHGWEIGLTGWGALWLLIIVISVRR